ncbi:serine protease [Candidatus Omnitrophota bacterium]
MSPNQITGFKVKKALLVVVLIFLVGALPANAIRIKKNVPVATNLLNFIQQSKRTAVLILVTKEKQIAGTGFLTINNKKEIIVVTNKHVTLVGRPIFVRVNAKSKVIDYAAEVANQDPFLDLAVLTLRKTPSVQKWISTDLIIPANMYGGTADIVEGKEVVFIGYPLGLGAQEKNYPVVRQGLIAQVIPKRKTFLVDGFASRGSSGSPVFEKTTGRLIGIVTSFEPDFIDSYEESAAGTKNLMTRIPINSGISKIISVESIKTLISK